MQNYWLFIELWNAQNSGALEEYYFYAKKNNLQFPNFTAVLRYSWDKTRR